MSSEITRSINGIVFFANSNVLIDNILMSSVTILLLSATALLVTYTCHCENINRLLLSDNFET